LETKRPAATVSNEALMKAESKTIGSSEPPDRLTTPIEFEEERGYRISARVMRAALILTAAALSWAAVTPIRELSTARGQLVPVTQVRQVQHLEGGIVEQILVEEGQIVEKDQPLMSLRAVTADSDLAALKVHARNLLLQKETGEALLAGRPPDFSAIPDVSPALAVEHLALYQRRLDHRLKEQSLLRARIDERKAEMAALQKEVVTQAKLADIQKQQLDARQVLAASGNMSNKQLLETETAHEQARVLLEASQGKLAAAEEGLKEAEAALAESDAQAQQQWIEEVSKASSELIEVQESLRKYADRVERLIIRAPTRGRVQQILQRSPGEVVRPGDAVAKIVPLDDALVAEVLVKPEDIAAVKDGDKAELKVTAYDFSKYGKIKGQVTDISPTTFEQEDKRYYYKVHIRFNPNRSDRFAAVWRLQPGMTVDADIISGSKSLLQYLLKPIYRGVDVAFSER
jgi:membrane fusion protein, adhesin transport system